jgi:hypothetical protein
MDRFGCAPSFQGRDPGRGARPRAGDGQKVHRVPTLPQLQPDAAARDRGMSSSVKSDRNLKDGTQKEWELNGGMRLVFLLNDRLYNNTSRHRMQ